VKVELIGVRQADRLIASALPASDRQRDTDIRALIDVFHVRHAGLPPDVAADISRGIAERGRADVSNPLRLLVYRRLLTALGLPEEMLRDPRQFDQLPRHLLIEKCLIPLAALTAEEVGTTIIFTRDPYLAEYPEADYARYAAVFRKTIEALCAPAEDGAAPRPIDLFWERSAHVLWSELQDRRFGRVAAGHGLAATEVDGRVLRFVHGLSPDVLVAPDATRLHTEFAEEQNPLLSHPRQGGVVGIHVTSRLDDIEDFLVSEFMLPPAIVADKLLNGMSMAKHRPPPFDERRQVLVLGGVIDDETPPSLALAKTAWLDAVFRFAILLFKNDLIRSELRFGHWIEGAGVARAATTVGDYPHLGSLDPVIATRWQMRRFFCDTGWLPGLIAGLPNVPVENKAAGGLATDFRAERLMRLLDRIAPELAVRVAEDDAVDFSVALATIFTVENASKAPVRQQRHGNGELPLAMLTIDCPATLEPEAVFIIEASEGGRADVSMPPARGDHPDIAMLNQTSSLLTQQIFDFYWAGLNG
jgi:hypothetical protein